MGRLLGIEPRLPGPQPGALPLSYSRHGAFMPFYLNLFYQKLLNNERLLLGTIFMQATGFVAGSKRALYCGFIGLACVEP